MIASPGSVTAEELAVAEQAIADADSEGRTPEEAKAYKEEKAQVSNWLGRIQAARDFDKEVWRQMSVDRGYAAGFSAHEVSVNLIGSAIDVMKSFLYAKNPDVSVAPAKQAAMPHIERPQAPIKPLDPMTGIMQSPQAQALIGQDVGAANAVLQDPAVQQQLAPIMAQAQIANQQYEMEQAQYIQAEGVYRQEMTKRRAMRDMRKRFSETMEILISKAWSLADMKGEARASVGASLTTSIGWMKMAWHEDRGLDPVSARRLASLQENLSNIDVLRARVAEGGGENLDALRQEIVESMAAIETQTEELIARGLVIDAVPAEDMTTPIGVTRIAKPVESPWLGHRFFMHIDKAKSTFTDVKPEKWKKVTTWSQRKPRMVLTVATDSHPGFMGLPEDAGQFTQGADGNGAEMNTDASGDFICGHEIWDKTEGVIRTVIEGLDCYARPPHPPEIAVTRFYPFYNMAFVEADGQRYPQSLVRRSCGLQDEYNARRSALKKQRHRAKQGIIADASVLDKDEAGKIKTSVEGETTYVYGTNGGQIGQAFMAKPTVQLDPALYEVDSIRRDFEEMWGIQQALQGGISVEKTATEADIQQQGFSAKTAFMREPLEAALQEMAVATAEILLQRLNSQDAMEFAGPGAVWPDQASVSDLASLVSVQIKAGSTGKPNTAAERNAWAQTMPLVTEAIQQIGALRGAPPQEVADKLERVLEITLQLSGSSLDVAEITPQESASPMPQMPDEQGMGGPPGGGPPMPAQPMNPPPDAAMPPV
ncbi:MAG: hypothetical protein ACTS6J_21230 [Burkholderiales bacterium]